MVVAKGWMKTGVRDLLNSRSFRWDREDATLAVVRFNARRGGEVGVRIARNPQTNEKDDLR
jgi:hypothetical protein